MIRSAMFFAVVAALMIPLAFMLTGCGEPAGESGEGDDSNVLRVGVVLPMNGPIATYGREAWNGLRLSGLDGFEHEGVRVELELYDNNSESLMTRTRVETAVQDGAELIIGAVASSNSRAGMEAASREEVLMISPASTNIDLTRENEFFTRVCFTDAVQGAAAAELAVAVLEENGVPQEDWRAGILDEQGNVYSTGLGSEFRNRFEELGGEIVASASFQEDDSQFGSQISDIAAGNPTAVFIPAYYDDVGVILRQAVEDWQGAYIFGGDGWDSPDLFSLAGSALGELESYITSHFVADEDREEVRTFVEQYERRFEGDTPGAMSALGYDSGLVVRDAVVRAIDAAGGKPTRQQLAEAVLYTSGVAGVTGEITIDPETREVTKDPILARVTEDGLTYFVPQQ